MKHGLDSLIELSSPPLSDSSCEVVPEGKLGSELEMLYAKRNGFFAFENALHVYANDRSLQPIGALQLNAQGCGWRHLYGSSASGYWFFAQDAFGNQFGVVEEVVVAFDVETGETTHIADSISEWARCVLDDFDYWTGHSLCRSWQVQNGSLMPGDRLVPSRPFILGGEYCIANLYSLESLQALSLRAELFAQTRDVPDGATVRLRIAARDEGNQTGD